MTANIRPSGGRGGPEAWFGNMRGLFSGSLRTQLIAGNIVAVSLLVGGLGIACRFIILSYMLQSVDQEMERGIGMYLHPPRAFTFHGPDFPGGPGPPPQERGDRGRGHGNARDLPPEPERGDGPPGGSGEDGPPPMPPPDGMRRHEDGGHQGPRGSGPHGPPPRDAHHGPDARPPQLENAYRPHMWTPQGTSESASDTRAAWDKTALARALAGETLTTTVIINDEPLRVLSSPGFTFAGKRGAVQTAYPLKEVDRAMQGINTALLLLLPIALSGAGWVGVALTNRVLRRVHGLTQAAERIGAHDLSQRLPAIGSDEFARLAQTFNGLLARLDGAFAAQKQTLEQQRRFTADASHELKTPLTIIKGRAGLALARETTDARSRSAFGEIDAATETMSHLVQDLLLLARSDEGLMARSGVEMLAREPLEAALAQSVKGDCAPVTLHIEPETLLLYGNQPELTRLFRNLLDNALHYTPPTGHVTLTARGENANVVVTVSDTGAGIAPEHLPHLGERFYRVDESRTRPTGGTGLGLSICRSIVHAHGGAIQFQSGVGAGTTVTVTLPQGENQ